MPVLQLMLETVAKALGPGLCQQMTFVGGCTTGLLLTGDYRKEQVRHTDDVDLIVHVMGYVGFHSLQRHPFGPVVVPDAWWRPLRFWWNMSCHTELFASG